MHSKNFINQFKEDIKFLKGWVKNPKAVGAIKPTGEAAARHMASQLPLDKDLPVLELGPGTGVITREILLRGLAPEKLVSIEYSKSFYNDLVQNFPGVQFVHGDAFDLHHSLKHIKYFEFSGVIGAVPLLNVPVAKRIRIIDESLKRITGRGPFIQISYGPKPPVDAVPGKFTVEKSGWILRNLPPAGIWIYRRETH